MEIATTSPLGSRRRPEESRAAILQAAVREFANEGVSGARTDAIADAAKVNKALLYYYFRDKDALYGAVLDHVFGGLTQSIHRALSRDLPPSQRILAYAGAHFDYIASNPLYPRIVQMEMMRAGRGRPAQFERIVNQYFRPIFTQIAKALAEGISQGEFRDVDPMNFIPSMISVIVFHFTAAPVMRMMSGADPMSPRWLAIRRAAVLDFISAALFVKTAGSQSAHKKSLRRIGAAR
jgi:TetR/AcrR family transcriptional regulator